MSGALQIASGTGAITSALTPSLARLGGSLSGLAGLAGSAAALTGGGRERTLADFHGIEGLFRGGATLADVFPSGATLGGLPISSLGAEIAADTARAAAEAGVQAGSTAGGSLAGTLGAGASLVGGAYNAVQGLSALMGSDSTERQRALGAIQLAGVAASPFTFGLSNLAAPITALLTEHLPWHPGSQIFNALFGEGDYLKKRIESGQIGAEAARSLVSGYSQALGTGDPAQLLAAFQRTAGDLPGEARGPVRSAMSPSTAQAIGVPAAWSEMTPEGFMRVLTYFAEDPTRLTAAKGRELGGTGEGAVVGSGDVGYLDQQTAQMLAHSMASTTKQALQALLLQQGRGPKMDAIRVITGLQRMPPEQVSALPLDLQALIAVADPSFDPWASQNPVQDYKNSEEFHIGSSADGFLRVGQAKMPLNHHYQMYNVYTSPPSYDNISPLQAVLSVARGALLGLSGANPTLVYDRTSGKSMSVYDEARGGYMVNPEYLDPAVPETPRGAALRREREAAAQAEQYTLANQGYPSL